MPLRVYNQDDNPLEVRAVFELATDLKNVRIGDAGMGAFFVARCNQHVAIVTSGAATCQIIIVHKRQDLGALGHFGGTHEPLAVLRGLEKMVAKIGGGPIDTVVYAAGNIGVVGPQKFYEVVIFGGTHRRYPGATVRWPTQDASRNWGSAIYLPHTSELALYHELPGAITGIANGTAGVSGYAF